MTLISTKTANNTSPYVTFTGISGYNSYMVMYNGILQASGTNGLRCQVGYGSTTWVTSYSMGYRWFIANSGGYYSSGNVSQSSWALSGDWSGNIQSPGANGQIFLTGTTTAAPIYIWGSSTTNGASGYEANQLFGYSNIGNQITAFRIFLDAETQNMQYGTISLYGISS